MQNRVAVVLAAVAACWGCQGSTPAASEGASISLQGAGATFPYPLYSKWVAEYQRHDPRVRINYQSIGSGGGIRQISERTVDFGASDAPMTDDELNKTKAKLLHVPTALGAVVVAYNLPGVAGLRLTPEAIAGIFLGEITSWSDPKIVRANPGLKLPTQSLLVTYRSDGSGTTAVFSEYLAKVSHTWRDKVGSGKSVTFPVGLGAKGNEGVAGQIRSTPGAVGYVELAYARQSALAFAAVENQAKEFVLASVDSVKSAAAAVADRIPEDLRVSIVDPPGREAYPIASFTYILVYVEQPDAVKGKALAQFLWWAIHDGQRLAPTLDYAPLPSALTPRVEAELKRLTASGTPLL